MKTSILFALLATAIAHNNYAQGFAINETGASAGASALLDVASTTKGILVPRMTTAQRTTIASPATGLLAYDTNLNQFYFYNGSGWTAIPTGANANNYWTLSGSSLYNNSGTNIGIGITAPSAFLDITGTNAGTSSLQLRSGNTSNSTSSNQVLFGYNGSTNYRHAIKTRHNSGGTTGNAIDFYVWKFGTDATTTAGTQQVLTLDGSGNVGIGTTAPAHKLQVSLSAGNFSVTDFGVVAGTVLMGQYTGTSAGPQVRFTGAGSGFADVGQNSTGDFVVEQNDAARLIVTTTGNVGMGTTSPGYKLTVQDAGPVGAATISTGSYSNIITASASGAESANYYSTYTGGTVLKRWAYGKNDDTETGSNAGSDFFINRYNDAGVYLNRVMNVKRSTGYIAIGGNFIPDEQLHINGKTKTTGLQVTGGAANGFVLQSDGSGNATWVNANTLSIAETDPKVGALTNNYLSRWNGSTLTNSTVFDNGNVGIGTTVPASTLTVSGSVAASVNITAASLTLTGSDYCVIYTGGTGNTFTLPAAGTCTGRLYMIVNHGTDELAISAYRTGNATTATSLSTGATLQLVSDGTEWRKIN